MWRTPHEPQIDAYFGVWLVDENVEAHLTKPVSMELLLAVLDRCASDLKVGSG